MFCRECGKELKEHTKFCTNCGQEISIDDKFCVNCGKEINRSNSEVNDNVRIKVDGSGSYDDILPNIKRMIEKRDKSKHYYVRGTFTGANTDFYEDVKAMVNEGFRA